MFGVPSRTLTSNLEFRTLPLCALSYGDDESGQGRNPLSVFSRASSTIALTVENSGFLLFVQPLKEFLKTGIRQDDFDRVERVPKFIVTPRLVNEILAGVARRHDLGSAFATRDYMMSAGGDSPLTKHAAGFLISDF
jgi:hypothetical protein